MPTPVLLAAQCQGKLTVGVGLNDASLLIEAVKVGCQVRACKQLRHSTGQRLAFAQTQATAARGYMITDNELSAVTTGYASRDREAELTSSKLGETDQPAVTRPGPGSQVKEQRPNSTQYIRNYCRQRTTIFHHDFNARALRKRQERLQNNGALMQAIPKQQAHSPLPNGKQQTPMLAAGRQSGELEQQLKQNYRAKRNTERLYDAFLDAARKDVAFEANAKQMAEGALAAEHQHVEETEAKLEGAAKQQELLTKELIETHAMLDSAEATSQHLKRQLVQSGKISGL